jgi:YegS/Rv2252/BmrU family lipid kinase
MTASLFVIINPASGNDEVILNVLNPIMQEAGIDWQVSITQDFGDGRKFARQAVEQGYQTVAVYGGDGSVVDAAAGLLESDVPLAIFPGGTGNVVAKELGIPLDLESACRLAASSSHRTRQVDLGVVNDEHYFLLRYGTGWEAELTDLANRELKDRIGIWAYALGGIQAMGKGVNAHYRLKLDGEQHEVEGITCMIANTGNVGIPGINLNVAPGSDMSDGLLDVVIFSASDVRGWLQELGAQQPDDSQPAVPDKPGRPQIRYHWQARAIEIEADPPQKVTLDGEMIGETPSKITLLPEAVRVIVPGDEKQ